MAMPVLEGLIMLYPLLLRETPNSILNKSVEFRVKTWLRQIVNTPIVIDPLAVMALYRFQVRATSFSFDLGLPCSWLPPSYSSVVMAASCWLLPAHFCWLPIILLNRLLLAAPGSSWQLLAAAALSSCRWLSSASCC